MKIDDTKSDHCAITNELLTILQVSETALETVHGYAELEKHTIWHILAVSAGGILTLPRLIQIGLPLIKLPVTTSQKGLFLRLKIQTEALAR